MDETWKSISGYYGIYEVSNLGRVKSLKQDKIMGKILKPRRCTKGYMCVSLYNKMIAKQFKIHRLVLTEFVGSCPDGMEGMHLDDDKSNNKLSNLMWGTSSENNKMKYDHGHGFDNRGEFHSMSKLNNGNIIRIRDIYKNSKVEFGYWKKLSQAIGVAPNTVHSIKSNKTWRHI